MQRARAVDSFTETFDLNEGSLPSNTSMDHSGSWDSIPIENRTNGWNNGESSSITHNLHEEALGHDSDARIGWSSAFHPYSATDPTSEGWSFQPSNISSTSHTGNQVTSRLPTMPTFVPNRFSHNIDSTEREPIPTNCYPSSNRGKHSGASSSFFESTNLPGSSSSWGPSYKRKALEGTSGQFSQGGSSSSNAMTDNFMHYNAYGNYTPLQHFPLNMSNNTEQLNSRNGAGMSGVPPRFFPSSTNLRLAEGSGGHHNVALNNGYRDPYEFETSVGTSVGQHPIVSGRLSRPVSTNEIPTTVTSQARLARVSEQREMPAYPWNGPVSSRGSISSNSLMEVNERTSLRNNLEYPINFSPETRNVSQDHIDWSFHSIPSAPFTSRPSSSRIGPSSGGHASSSSPSLSYLSRTLQDHQRLVEASLRLPYQPWMESESASQNSHFESSSSSEAAVASRQRLIRHVLRAMSSGVELPPELDELVLIDPLMNGYFELHDQHRDMRLDVDSMSYEELLALEEQIGDVNTGLSEPKIWGSMRQRRHGVMVASPNLEPCCICQENYISGDNIGILDCAHEFHSSCISQWLKLKNLCPICKMTALKT